MTIVVEDSLPSLVRGWRVHADNASFSEMLRSVLALMRTVVDLKMASVI
jgi:hypothetical protein